MPRGGIKELREMQIIANSKTDKVYKGYPTTKEEWIQTLEQWLEPELSDIISMYGGDSKTIKSLIEQKDYVSIYTMLSRTWAAAPDDIGIHSDAGWDVLCDLCSEAYLLDK